MRGWLVGSLVVTLLLAGCSGSSGSGGDDVVVTSKLPTEVGSGEGETRAEPPKEGTRGHLAGYVVSDTIRPIEDAVIRLPGMDLEQKSDREGSFGFVDLRPGPYFITVNATGYYGAETEFDIDSGEFTRLKFVLTPIPPPEPYHHTDAFEAYAEVTQPPILTSGLYCSGCSVPFYLDGKPTTLIIEAVAGGSATEFELYLGEGASCCRTFLSTSGPSPLRVEIPGDSLPSTTDFNLRIYPTALVPETAKRFEFFVTAFYNEPAPDGWSFVRGDP